MPLETIKELDDLFDAVARENTQALIKKDLLLETEYAKQKNLDQLQRKINKRFEATTHTKFLTENL